MASVAVLPQYKAVICRHSRVVWNLRGKYKTLDLTAGERRGCCSSTPQVQPVVRLKIYPQQACAHNSHVHVHICAYIHGQPHRSDRHTQHSHKHKQHQQPYPAPLTGRAAWRSTSENIYICVDIYTVCVLPSAWLVH